MGGPERYSKPFEEKKPSCRRGRTREEECSSCLAAGKRDQCKKEGGRRIVILSKENVVSTPPKEGCRTAIERNRRIRIMDGRRKTILSRKGDLVQKKKERLSFGGEKKRGKEARALKR